MTDVIGRSAIPATPVREGDMFVTPAGDAFSLAYHRTVIHARPQHGCTLCEPTPCACGFTGELCPDYFRHRRDDAGAEIAAWRAAS